MSVLVDKDTRLVVTGLTGREGTFHALNNRTYGTNVVAGVTPGKGGQDVEGIPVFDTVHAAVEEAGANTAMIFVPPRFAADSILEALDAGIRLVVAITEGIPAHDELRVYTQLKRNPGARLVGPNCPGILSPGKANVGIIPASFFKEGNVGVVSRSGTLTYQIGNELAQRGFGNSLDRRHRRRPGPRLVVHRRHRAVRGRPADRADRDVRRDRRLRRGGGRRVHRGQRLEARRRLHRRLHRAARQDDGPRRRDRLRHAPARRERRPRRSRRRASASAARRPRRPRSPCRSCRPDARLARSVVWEPWLPNPLRSPSPAALRRSTSSTSTACAPPPTAPSRTTPPARPPTARRSATDRCARGSPRSTASPPEQVIVTNGSMQADAFLFEALVEDGDVVVVEKPTYDRTLLSLRSRGADVRPVELQRGRDRRGGRRGAVRRRPKPRLAHVIPNFQNPAGYTLSAEKRRALVVARRRARHDDLRGRPLRRAALQRRGAADDAVARPGRQGRLRVVVLEDGLPRHPRRLPRRAGEADRADREARDEHLHLAEHGRPVDRQRVLRVETAVRSSARSRP